MPPPDNGSGHGSGCYASDSDAAEYRKRMSAYLAMRNGAWLDRHQDPHTGEIQEGIKELANVWQVDNHIVKWAIRHGLLHPGSIKRDGLQHRQIGRLSALIYFRDEQHRRALAFEVSSYLDGKEREQTVEANERASVRTG